MTKEVTPIPIDYYTLFCFVDDFFIGFEPWYKKQLLAKGLRKRQREGSLKLSEIATILIAYHQSGMACFKYFYLSLCQKDRSLFPGLVPYDRFIKLVKQAFPALLCLLQRLQGTITEYLFIDATPMALCHTLREKRHQVFKGLAKKGKSSTGWFFGFKLPMIVNTKGELVRLKITPGNVDDRASVREMVQGLTAKLIGDKGYLSQELFKDLLGKGVTLITRIKKNMKNCLMGLIDKMRLLRRSFIETIFSSLKALDILIHHPHRCPPNAFTHLLAGLIHYQLRTDKPSLETLLKLNP